MIGCSNKEKVEFKGSKDGITIIVSELDKKEDIINCISEKLKGSLHFFEGARICGMETELKDKKDIQYVKNTLKEEFNLEFLDRNINSKKKDKTSLKEKNCESVEKRKENLSSSEKGKIKNINGLRSGEYEIYDGSVIVMSDMKPGSMVISGGDVLIMGNMHSGAKVVAEGNVVVMGKLSGFVHAGSKGNKSSYIAANSLKPTILQIADIIAEAPEEVDEEDNNFSEIAFVSAGSIVIDARRSK